MTWNGFKRCKKKEMKEREKRVYVQFSESVTV